MFADSKLPRPYMSHKDRVATSSGERPPAADKKQRSILKMLSSIFQTWTFDCEYAAEIGASLSYTRPSHFDVCEREPSLKKTCPYTLPSASPSPSPSSSSSSSPVSISSSPSESSPAGSLSPSPSSSPPASPSSSPPALCNVKPARPVQFRSVKRSCLKNAKRPLRCRGRRYPLYLILEREGEPEDDDEEEEEEEKTAL